MVSDAQSSCGAQSYEFRLAAGTGNNTQATKEVSSVAAEEQYVFAFAEHHETACVTEGLLRVAQFTVSGPTAGSIDYRFDLWLDGTGIEVLAYPGTGSPVRVLRLDQNVPAETWNEVRLEFEFVSDGQVEVGATFDGTDLEPSADEPPPVGPQGEDGLGSHTNRLLVGASHRKDGSFTACTMYIDHVRFDGPALVKR